MLVLKFSSFLSICKCFDICFYAQEDNLIPLYLILFSMLTTQQYFPGGFELIWLAEVHHAISVCFIEVDIQYQYSKRPCKRNSIEETYVFEFSKYESPARNWDYSGLAQAYFVICKL